MKQNDPNVINIKQTERELELKQVLVSFFITILHFKDLSKSLI